MNVEAFFKLSYGLYIISSKSENGMSGYIANTAFQVTADPPQIAISCHKNNYSAKIIDEGKSFSISVLDKEADTSLIGLFGYNSGNDKNKFENLDYEIGKTKVPIVKDQSVAFFECEVVDKFDVGTHVLFIGKVVDGDLINGAKDPLTYSYYRDAKKGVAPKNAPTYIDKSKIKEDNEDKNTSHQNELGPSYVCEVCSYVYDPAVGDETQGIPPGTAFADLPDDWVCPVCAAAKSDFVSEN